MSVTHLHGDCLDVLPTLPDKSVQCCVTSPPYWGLRDYGVAGQLGLEKTPDEYVAKMVAVFREVKRVLRDDGTLWLNLGDSYAGGTVGRNDMDDATLARRAATYGTGRGPGAGPRGKSVARSAPDGLKTKDLCGIPWRVAFALQADGWYLRSDIIWHKPNPMPESVTDRPTKAHEYLFLLTKSASYFYDADAIAEPQTDATTARYAYAKDGRINGAGAYADAAAGVNVGGFIASNAARTKNPHIPTTGTRNRRSVWTVATRPYKGAHFATFPPKLIEPCILAGTSPQACEHCAAPWDRVMSGGKYEPPTAAVGERFVDASRGDRTRKLDGKSKEWREAAASRATVGWQPTCDCENNTGSARCVVLDPFGGSGTTAMVAEQHGRNAILIELNESYIGLQRERMAKVQPSSGVA